MCGAPPLSTSPAPTVICSSSPNQATMTRRNQIDRVTEPDPPGPGWAGSTAVCFKVALRGPTFGFLSAWNFFAPAGRLLFALWAKESALGMCISFTYMTQPAGISLPRLSRDLRKLLFPSRRMVAETATTHFASVFPTVGASGSLGGGPVSSSFPSTNYARRQRLNPSKIGLIPIFSACLPSKIATLRQ